MSFSNRMERFRGSLVDSDYSNNIWLLRRGVYLAIFLNFLLLLPAAEYFFGSDSLVFGYNMIPDWLDPFFRVLFSQTFGPHYQYFIGLLFVLLISGSFKPLVRWIAPLIYIITINLFNKAEFIANGSVSVTSILLLLLVFMSEQNIEENNKLNYLNSLITNTSFWLARFQICVVYLTAGVFKLTGENWIGGEAFYYALNFQFLSHEGVANFLFKSELLLYAGNYFALFYQLLFPLLVWIKPIKKWLLLLGVFLHLSIIFVNGLVDFGLIMLVSYSLFLNSEKIGFLRKKLSLKAI